MARIYVSSTFQDLAPVRARVLAALRKLGHEDVAMEHYVATSNRPLEHCLSDVEACQLYLGLFGWRYGYVPPGQNQSITELEFRHALQKKKDCLLFLQRAPNSRPPANVDPRLVTLRNEIQETFLAGFFTDEGDVEPLVLAAVAHWDKKRAVRPRPFQAPPLPPDYVERVDVIHSLIEELERSSKDPGVVVVTALHGLGGIGKTTTAAAVAHSPRVNRRFPDGVLWATLGETADCLSNLVAWIYAFSEQEYRPTTVAAATQYLRTLLYGRSALLILDDVWNIEDARHFLVGGESCRIVVTTRRAQIADDLGADIVSLQPMSSAEAVALLRRRAGVSQSDSAWADWPLAQELADRVGHLPLALQLMGALVRRGYGWQRAIDDFDSQMSQGSRLAHARTPAQQKIDASLRVSLERLRRDDATVWMQFVWLGILREEATIDERVSSVLWRISKRDARMILQQLADEALLLPYGQGFRLHDLMREVAYRTLTSGEPHGLGQDANAAHRYLLDAYRTDIARNRWDELPDDGYIQHNLVWHLRKGEQIEAIHELLQLTGADGSNLWWSIRSRLGQGAGFIEDVRFAWGLNRERVDSSIPLSLRYAATIAAMESLSEAVPTELLATLVQRGLWTPEQALDRIRRLSRGHRRLEIIVELLRDVTGNAPRELLIREALENFGSDSRNSASIAMLGRLAYAATGSLRGEVARHAIHTIGDWPEGARDLARVLPIGPWFKEFDLTVPAERQEISWIIRTRMDEGRVRETRMSAAEALRQFDSALDHGGPEHVALMVAAFRDLPEPREEHARKALAAYEYFGPEHRAELFTRLLPALRAGEAIAIARSQFGEAHRGIGFESVLAAELNESHREIRFRELIASLDTIGSPAERRFAATALLRTAPHHLASELLQSIQRIRDLREQAGVLIALLPHLENSIGEDFLDALAVDNQAGPQVATIVNLVSEISNAIQGYALEEFVAEASQLVSEWWIVEALTLMVQRLENSDQLDTILGAARHIKTSDLQSRLIGRIAIQFGRLGLVREAINASFASPLPIERPRIICDVALDLLRWRQFDDAITVASAITQQGEADKAFSAIALQLAAAGENSRAAGVITRISTRHWRQFAESLVSNSNTSHPSPVATEITTSRVDVQLEQTRLRQAAAIIPLLRSNGVDSHALYALAAATNRNDEPAARIASQRFLREPVRENRSYLELISDLPRPEFLASIRRLAPILVLALQRQDLEQVAADVRRAAAWWP